MSGAPKKPLPFWVWLVAVAIGVSALVLYLVSQYPETLDMQDARISLARSVLILVAVVAAAAAGWRYRPKLALNHGLIWIAIGGVLVIGYSFRHEAAWLGERVMAEINPGRGIVTSEGVLELIAGDDGHFRLDVLVEGTPVRMLIDTGATQVTLSVDVARRIGFDPNKLRYTEPMQTANGTSFGAPVRLRELRFGEFRFADVSATVSPGLEGTALLGLNVLARLSGYEVRGDRMILRR